VSKVGRKEGKATYVFALELPATNKPVAQLTKIAVGKFFTSGNA
jgi:hypothetical protein